MTAPAVWVDVHAHAGRCFLAGLDGAAPLAGALGSADIPRALLEAREAGMAAVTLATVGDLGVLAPHPDKGLYASRAFAPGEARAGHQRQLDGISRAIDALGAPLAMAAADIERAAAQAQTAVLLTCEGGDFLEGDLAALADARARGVSSLTLVHYRVNEIGDVQTEDPVHGGLSAFGREVVTECNRLGMIVDCAHATFETTIAALERSADPIMISHSHLDHAGRHHPRLLSTAHARAVASAGGLIGAWPSGVTSTGLGDFVDEIVRLADLVGIDHVAIGTDLDANYRPVLASYADYALLPEMLARRGLGSAETAKVLGGNFLRLFRAVAG